MKAHWALAALAFLAASLSASGATSELDTFIEATLPQSAAPGLAYARVDQAEIAAEGFGEVAEDSARPVTANTVFPIGSVTKSFTALAIMQLVEDGALQLDDPVSRHLPAFSDSPARNVTLRQLLSHTSGFSTVQGNSHHGLSDASQIGLLAYAKTLAQITPDNPAGTVWEYSNANYHILGAVIEKTSGTTYPDYIAARIFEPLGMTDSTAYVDVNSAATVTGHRPWFGGVRPMEGGEGYAINAPIGGIVSSARDMGKYLAMWLSSEDEILSAQGKAAMLVSAGPASPDYGLGWSIDHARGTVFHTGLVPGSETLASLNPTERKGVVVMVNANGGFGFSDTWYLIGGTGARAMGQPHTDDGSRLGPKTAYLSIVLLPPLFLLFLAFSWMGREKLPEKRESIGGKASLWFPVVAMIALVWFLLALLPRAFGGSLATIQLFQPDFALCLIATAVLAPLWALSRLGLAYLRR